MLFSITEVLGLKCGVSCSGFKPSSITSYFMKRYVDVLNLLSCCSVLSFIRHINMLTPIHINCTFADNELVNILFTSVSYELFATRIG